MTQTMKHAAPERKARTPFICNVIRESGGTPGSSAGRDRDAFQFQPVALHNRTRF